MSSFESFNERVEAYSILKKMIATGSRELTSKAQKAGLIRDVDNDGFNFTIKGWEALEGISPVAHNIVSEVPYMVEYKDCLIWPNGWGTTWEVVHMPSGQKLFKGKQVTHFHTQHDYDRSSTIRSFYKTGGGYYSVPAGSFRQAVKLADDVVRFGGVDEFLSSPLGWVQEPYRKFIEDWRIRNEKRRK